MRGPHWALASFWEPSSNLGAVRILAWNCVCAPRTSDFPAMTADVRTRFAPSPTGYLHIGGVRTALYSWLLARHYRGTFLLRIEDTDRERSTQPAIDAILSGMAWVELTADQPAIYQTQRFGRYSEVADQLLAAGKAYHCYCTREELDAMRAAALAEGRKPRYDGRCRNGAQPRDGVSPAVRFKNPTSGEVV